jgi:hypothetical protein
MISTRTSAQAQMKGFGMKAEHSMKSKPGRKKAMKAGGKGHGLNPKLTGMEVVKDHAVGIPGGKGVKKTHSKGGTNKAAAAPKKKM